MFWYVAGGTTTRHAKAEKRTKPERKRRLFKRPWGGAKVMKRAEISASSGDQAKKI